MSGAVDIANHNSSLPGQAAQALPDRNENRQSEMKWTSPILSLLLLSAAGCLPTMKQAPSNSPNITGSVSIPAIWGTDFQPAEPRSVSSLAETINHTTEIRAEADERLFLVSTEIFKFPFIYISVDRAFKPRQRESRNLGSYLRRGGFVLLDNAQTGAGFENVEHSLKALVKTALGPGARFQRLANSHPIYHSFFSFHDGPPGMVRGLTEAGGSSARSLRGLSAQVAERQQRRRTESQEQQSAREEEARRQRTSRPTFLEGVFWEGRLVAVYSNMAYGRAWTNQAGNKRFNTVQLKMGVNLVVFALTQPGSIAPRQKERHQAP